MKICILKLMRLFFLIIALCRMTQQADNEKNSQISKINVPTLYIMVPHIADAYSVVQRQKLGDKTDNIFERTKKIDYFVQKKPINKLQGKDIIQSSNKAYNKQLISQNALADQTKALEDQTKAQSIQKMIAEQRQRIYKEISQIADRQKKQKQHQNYFQYFQYILYGFVGILFAVVLISKSRKRKHSIPVQNDESVQFKSDRLEQQVGPQNQSDSSDEAQNQRQNIVNK